jgi:4-diphosphocytidyl-2-C-methyl-D-erythritol kinase
MISFPNAKINLGLFVTGKRDDGYHDIESVFYPIGLSDVLEVVIDEEGAKGTISFQSTGIEIPGDAQENLCVKAYRLINAETELPAVNVHLHKIIPIGAGLGGGSADGAFFVNQLNALCDLNLTEEQRVAYAAKLGSDCMFFIRNEAAFVSGRGEEISPFTIDLSGYYLVLVHPEIHVSTAEAYTGMEPKKPAIELQNALKNSPEEWNEVTNDFEKTVFSNYPKIEEIKAQLYAEGAAYAAMSGSGSAVYGIFKSPIDLSTTFSDYFLWQGQL